MSEPRPHETVDNATRETVLDRDGHRCQFCGKRGPGAGGAAKLQVHHIEREPEDREVHAVSNLTTLCRSCHSWQHQQTESEELPVSLTEADEAELLAQDKEILRVLAEHGPMRPGGIRSELTGDISGDSIRERLWLLMGLDNIVEDREQQVVDQDVDTGEWGLAGQIAESARGRIPDDQQRLVLRYEDALVRQALERGIDRNTIADLLGFSRRTTFYKEKRAYAYDFPLEAFQSGRRGWTGLDDDESDDGDPEMEAGDGSDEAIGDKEHGDVEVWTATDTDDSMTAAELLDDVEDVAEEMSAAEDDGTPETHLERAITALQAAKSAL